VTRNAGFAGAESADGKSLYFKTGSAAGELWNLPVDGGPTTRILPSVSGQIFTVTSKGI
jgi:hypothetical protein